MKNISPAINNSEVKDIILQIKKKSVYPYTT